MPKGNVSLRSTYPFTMPLNPGNRHLVAFHSYPVCYFFILHSSTTIYVESDVNQVRQLKENDDETDTIKRIFKLLGRIY